MPTRKNGLLVPVLENGEFQRGLNRPHAHQIQEVKMIVDELMKALAPVGIRVVHVQPRPSSADFDQLIFVPKTPGTHVERRQREVMVRELIRITAREVNNKLRPGTRLLQR